MLVSWARILTRVGGKRRAGCGERTRCRAGRSPPPARPYMIPRMPMLEGKTGIIFGVANKRSIAWAIAQALSREGMRLAFNYQGERLKEGVEELASHIPGSIVLPCDVTSDAEIDSFYRGVDEQF